MQPPVQPDPFRSTVGDIRACLEALREADRLLDAAPRTQRAELELAAVERRHAWIGEVAGLSIAAPGRLVGDVTVAATPGADRELADAIAHLRVAVAELGEHPSAAQLDQAIATCEHAPIDQAANGLSAVVRVLHPSLREAFGLLDAPPLTQWTVDDADDLLAREAAGVSRARRALRGGVVAAIVLACVTVALVQAFGPQSKADGMRALCDIPINCSPCMVALEDGHPRPFQDYLRKHVTSRELQPLFELMAATPADGVAGLRAEAAAQGIGRCTLADALARPIRVSAP